MRKRLFLIFISALFAVTALMAAAIPTGSPLGAVAMAALPASADPGGVPHYFGPYGNWAYSPLPKGPITSITLVDGGAGYSALATVAIKDVYGTGSGATVSRTIVGGVITAITLTAGGTNYSAPIVTITDTAGTGAAATASIAKVPLGGALTGGIRKFLNTLPQLGPTGANNIPQTQSHGAGQYIPVAVADTTTYPAVVGPPAKPASDYYQIALVEYTEKMHTDLPPTKLRGYVQIETPGSAVTPAGSNHRALPGVTFRGAQVYGYDYPHYLGPAIVASSNKPVRIKFYNLLSTGSGGNLFLPVDQTVMGSGMGPSVPGSAGGDVYTQNRAAVHLHGNNTVWISDGTPHQWITPPNEVTPYPQGVSVRNVPDMAPATVDSPTDGMITLYYTNAMSARLMFYHDHAMGITRLNVYAGEAAGYVITDQVDKDMYSGTNVSGVNPTLKKVLPDIGIPLVIQDRTFVDETTIWAQDPTWNSGTGPRDPATGKITAAVRGDLWYPHVYMTAQNPWDLSGVNTFGRWHYGPWFINQTPTCVDGQPVGCIEVGPVPNPYYQPACDGLGSPGQVCTTPWEPPMMPGTPNPSMPGEAFVDTPLVNGTVYPYLEVEPRAYRFRILNAANDRFFNLQLYVAADKTAPTTADTNYTLTPARLCDGVAVAPGAVANCTEVKMVPVSVAPANQYADTPSGIPDPATKGPDWIQIGHEGGFLPAPAVIPSQPVGFNLDPTAFNFGNVNQHSLFLGSAERADVVVDFSAYNGKTLILYNDAPAATPANVPVNDYFTGNGDQTDVGGAPNTQPGYGPNTRTVMQIRVNKPLTTPTPDVTLANLNAVFAKTATKRGVFEASQDPILIPQAAYNSAYNATVANPGSPAGFPTSAVGQYVLLNDTSKTFRPINAAGVLQPAITMPLQMKGLHDEMGGVYDTQFGRMSGMLGLVNPVQGTGVIIPYGYASPPTDVISGSVAGSQIGSLPDGTQIWRLFHNGVDTHPIHVHLFNAQLINRVAQDGIMHPPDANELGWKDTFRINPLEVAYIAMRPVIPTPAQVPFEVPDSIRLIDPTLPEGATLIPPPPTGWIAPDGVTIGEIFNHYVNFGWEYVWHCHILAHEEMDMMHSLVFVVPPTAPTNLAATVPATGVPRVNLTWTDNSAKEAKFTLFRATSATFTTGLTAIDYVNTATAVPNTVAYTDATVANNTRYWYKVYAIGNPVGDTQAYAGSVGFPVMSADSVSNTITVTVGTLTAALPANPTLLTATVQPGPQVVLTWRDNATNETGFAIERCTVVAPATTCTNFAQIDVAGSLPGTGSATYVDITATVGKTFRYQVWAVNAIGRSAAPTNAVSAVIPPLPAVPTSFRVSAVKSTGTNYIATLQWVTASNPTNFTIQRATNSAFTESLVSFTATGATRIMAQTVTRNTTYYYRIRANDAISGSSAWRNALPYPIRTGP